MNNQHNPKTYLADIISCIENCQSFTTDMDFITFNSDLKTSSAVLHQIMIIGEATKKLGTKFTANYPEIPWRHMAGMRDVLIHNYEDADLSIAWSVVQNEFPKLLIQLKAILK
jgi:uncharacterized protein with HEPN domain